MRTGTTAFLIALTAAFAAAAHAAPTYGSGADPSKLVLARTDFPAAAKYTWGRMPASYNQGLAAAGIRGSGAYFAVTLGSDTKYQSISGNVTVTGAPAQARKLFAISKRRLQASRTATVRLPRYGDEQVALYTSPKLGSKIQLLVRRNTVVWQLEVGGGGLATLSKGALTAEAKGYAGKLKRRVGEG